MVKSTLSTKFASLFSAQSKALAEVCRELDQLDADILAKRNRLAEVRDAPLSREEVESRVDSFLLDRETEARAIFSPESLIDPNGSGTGCRIETAFEKRYSQIGALCILGFRDIMRENLIREGVEAGNSEPVSSAVREKEIKRLDGEIVDLEKTRERFAREAETLGIKVPRSEHAHPAALLAPDSEL